MRISDAIEILQKIQAWVGDVEVGVVERLEDGDAFIDFTYSVAVVKIGEEMATFCVFMRKEDWPVSKPHLELVKLPPEKESP